MKTSKIFFISFILFVLCLVIYLFKSYLLTISVGILMAISTANLESKVYHMTGGKRALSASIMTGIMLLLFLAPLTYAIVVLASHAANFDMNYIAKVVDYIKNFDIKLPGVLESFEPKIKNFVASIDIGGVAKELLGYASKIWSKGSDFIVDLGFVVVFYFFANFYSFDAKKLLKENIPIENEHLEYISSQVANTMSVVLYSTIVNALLQGFLFGVIASIFGFNGILMGILFAFASLIPVVGGALVYVPLSIYELAIGNKVVAIVILLYSVIVISTLVDNFVKPIIIRFINSKLVYAPSNINEILIFFAMIAGISTFGFWGMILGPAIVTLFVATLGSYQSLKKKFDLE